jgi:hypothetical protein
MTSHFLKLPLIAAAPLAVSMLAATPRVSAQAPTQTAAQVAPPEKQKSPAAVIPEAAHPTRIFAPDSFWTRPLPDDAPLHPNSANFVEEFLRQKKAFYGTVSINTRAYACPIYAVGPDVKTVEVFEWDGQKKGWKDPALAAQWRAVPIPDYAAPADGTDGEMCIYQPSSDSLWEFWKARKVDGRWEAVWGGGMKDVSKNSGIWDKHYGTTATSLPFIGGQISAEELRRGAIEHVLGISLVELEHHNVISWPARRSDGQNPNEEPNRIPEGLRFRLDPSVDVESLNLGRAGKIIARGAEVRLRGVGQGWSDHPARRQP